MYFSVADIEVSWWIPSVVAFFVSLFTSTAGVSGAFLLLPFQMSFLGYATPSVSATNHIFNIVAIPSGVYRYIREKRMVWPLSCVVILGTLPGVILGAFIRVLYLPDPKNFKIFAALILGYIGIRMFKDVLKNKKIQIKHTEEDKNIREQAVETLEMSWQRISYRFLGQVYSSPTPIIFILCLLVGIIGGVYGIGGGAIVAPFFVSILGLPVYTVAGATLLGTLVTSVSGVFIFQILACAYPDQSIGPDWALGFLFGLGGMLGMYCGARMQKHIPARSIKIMLCIIVVGTSLKYMLEYLH